MTSLVYEMNRIYDLVADTPEDAGMSDMMCQKKDDLKTTIPNREGNLWAEGISLDVKKVSLCRLKNIGRLRSLQPTYSALPVALGWLKPAEVTPHKSEQTDYVWIKTSGLDE